MYITYRVVSVDFQIGTDFRGCSTRCAAMIRFFRKREVHVFRRFAVSQRFPGSFFMSMPCGRSRRGWEGWGWGGGWGGNLGRLTRRTSSALQFWLRMAWHQKLQGAIDLRTPSSKKRDASGEWDARPSRAAVLALIAGVFHHVLTDLLAGVGYMLTPPTHT